MRLASAIQAVACAGGTPWPDNSRTTVTNALSPVQTAFRCAGLLGSKAARSGWIFASSCALIAAGRVDALRSRPGRGARAAPWRRER